MAHKIIAKKKFGQNFLHNQGIIQKIIETGNIGTDETIIEIGPGMGSLTEELLKKAKHLIALEIDHDMIVILKTRFGSYKNFELIQTDALKFTPPEKYKIIANIPYYITSPLISHFLRQDDQPTSMTLLVQEEVARKICELEPDMSILSLQTGLFGKTTYIAKVSPHSFHPAPKVHSAIIHIAVYDKFHPDFTDPQTTDRILTLAKKAFSQKRKKLSTTLKDQKENFIKAGIDPNRRPETLSIAEWKALCRESPG